MSAIVGIVTIDGRGVDCDELEQMVTRLAHRGPDGRRVWHQGPVALGHLMLWTTPESRREVLPRMNASGDLVLTADARIDNRAELIAALRLTDGPPGEISDSQLLLAAYEKWGQRCPEYLLGDFAFALWDGRRQRLFCARDHFGVKTFYYHYRPGEAFVFATEIKALLSLPWVPRQLNEARVFDHLAALDWDRTSTFYRNILRLAAAHTLTVSREGVTRRCYWALDPARELRLPSDEAYADAFGERFAEAVGCRLRSAYPTGSLLSGGLDSSSIVCVARQLLAPAGDEPLHTFSAIFDDLPQCDERRFISAVMDGGGLEPHYVPGDRVSPFTDMERMMWHLDGAVRSANLFLHWGLYGAARQRGVRLLLDGLDGDTTVSHGLARLTELARSGRWIRLLAEATLAARRFNHPPWHYVWQRGLRPLAPEPVRRIWRAFRGLPGLEQWLALNPTIDPDFARRNGLEACWPTRSGHQRRQPMTAREDHYKRLTSGIIPFTLEVTDKAAAAFALEARYPFFDKRLVEFCLALPAEQKLSQGWTRMVMRRAMSDILPAKVQWRDSKADLSSNFKRRLLTADRAVLDEVILEDSASIAPYVDLTALGETYARCLARPNNRDAVAIWRAVSLAVWLRFTGLSV